MSGRPPTAPARLCSKDECNRPHAARGLCSRHYDQLNAHSDRHAEHSRVDAAGPCACNPFEDLIYGLPEYDSLATERECNMDSDDFMLSDGTRIDHRSNGRWRVVR